MEVIFRFEIGEIAIFKKGIVENELDPSLRPNLYMVIERAMQQCPGGSQVLYKVGGYKEWFNEIELAKLDAFDFNAARERSIQFEIDADAKKEDARIAQYQKRKEAGKTE